MSDIRSYSEMLKLKTFMERFEYLKLDGQVGTDTFGWQRWLNQVFYHSKEWIEFKRDMIIRDLGCDLACEGHEISKGVPVYMHHINPIEASDIESRSTKLLDPENTVTTIFRTHNAIHYGNRDGVIDLPTERSPNDTCPWRR